MLSYTVGLLADIDRNGYAVLDRFMPCSSTAEVVGALGEVVALPGVQTVHRLTPREAEATHRNTYSKIFGTNAFPLHTDFAHWYFPPRYLVLRCVKGFDNVATPIVDGAAIVNEIGEATLARSLVQPRRPVAGKLPLLRLFKREAEASIFRWDEIFIRPATSAGAIGVNCIKELLARTERTSICLSNPGDTLVADNWRILHGRTHVPDACKERVVERAYLGALN